MLFKKRTIFVFRTEDCCNVYLMHILQCRHTEGFNILCVTTIMEKKQGEEEKEIVSSAKRRRSDIFVNDYCKRIGINEKDLDSNSIPEIGIGKIANGLVIELLSYCNIHFIPVGRLYSWVQNLAKPYNLEDVCSQKKFITKARRLKEKLEKLRNVAANGQKRRIFLSVFFNSETVQKKQTYP